MISQETIDELLERASLVEIVGEVVPLKRAGGNYVGLCPFHSEKSPSFNVRENEGYFHCFGCGESGNIFKFVMEMRGLSFPEAVEELAARYGVRVKIEGSKAPVKAPSEKDKFYRINDFAWDFFTESLRDAPSQVIEYAKSRGITAQAVKEFGVGFAPATWNSLVNYLKKCEVPEEIVTASGLVKRNDRGELYDVFRGRLIFPVWIDQKKISGFGGRIIPALFDEATLAKYPKYLNSPESPVYQKSKILYGMPHALPSVRDEGEIYIVEGYLDVVSLALAGVKNVVATCGTALTESHVKRLAQIAKKVVVLFDGDEAGRTAAGKSFATFLNSGVDVAALFLPEEDDPDTAAKKYGTKTLEYLKGLPRRALLDCYFEYLLGRMGAKEIRELGAALKGKLATEIVATLSKIENSVERGESYERAALLLRVDSASLKGLADKARQSKTPMVKSESSEEDEEAPTPIALRKPIQELPRVDRDLLLAIMAKKDFLPAQMLRDGDLCSQPGGVDFTTLTFVQELARIVGDTNKGEEQKKEAIRGLLRDFGDSWIAHWKQAYSMVEDKGVDLVSSYEGCRTSIRKSKLTQQVKELDREFALATEDNERLEIMKRKMELTQRIKEVDTQGVRSRR